MCWSCERVDFVVECKGQRCPSLFWVDNYLCISFRSRDVAKIWARVHSLWWLLEELWWRWESWEWQVALSKDAVWGSSLCIFVIAQKIKHYRLLKSPAASSLTPTPSHSSNYSLSHTHSSSMPSQSPSPNQVSTPSHPAIIQSTQSFSPDLWHFVCSFE